MTEVFRRHPSVIRSLSPTHCTAGLGAKAKSILANHEDCKVSVGLGSPYHKLIEERGKIVLLGVGHASNTTLHFVENTNGAPTICGICYEPCVIDGQGHQIVVPTYPHMPGLARNYGRVESALLAAGLQKMGEVGWADTRVVEAAPMADLIGARIHREPLFLIEPFSIRAI